MYRTRTTIKLWRYAGLLLLLTLVNQVVIAAPVLTGIDVLQRESFRMLEGRNIGLITNQTGINQAGVRSVQLLHDASNINLVAVFSPEHGLLGQLDIENIADSRDTQTGLQVFSIYGETRAPTPGMMKGIDTLVFDIQDIGTRFYTYISTMGESMRAAAANDIRFVVLDRPNPINGTTVSGPVLDEGLQSFVGFHRLPIRHGMTVGELALMFKTELKLDIDLQIIQIEGWQRRDYFDATGLKWINPSPNMRSLTEAILYPGIGLLETTNISVGRGTATPFEWFGAPWMDGERLALELNKLELPGVSFYAVTFTPDASKFEGELCHGVGLTVTDISRFQPVKTGFEIALKIRHMWPDDWETERYIRLLSNQSVFDAILAERNFTEIEAGYMDDLSEFLQRRAAYLIYD